MADNFSNINGDHINIANRGSSINSTDKNLREKNDQAYGPTLSDLKVFLCHCNEDKERVKQLHHQLVAMGCNPWLDSSSLSPGQDWDEEIERIITKSDLFFVCLSKQLETKIGYVQKEIRRALEWAERQPQGSVYLIPVKLEQCNIPTALQKYHSVDVSIEGGIERLADAMRRKAFL